MSSHCYVSETDNGAGGGGICASVAAPRHRTGWHESDSEGARQRIGRRARQDGAERDGHYRNGSGQPSGQVEQVGIGEDRSNRSWPGQDRTRVLGSGRASQECWVGSACMYIRWTDVPDGVN